jgi:hypothetical protein
MNNRIRIEELYKLAHIDYNGSKVFDPAKFAELIIAECVDIADDYVKDFLVEEHIKFNHPRSKIGLKIKRHFGVGEK